MFVPAAGLPWFVALFGRDTLIVSLQTMIVYPEFATGALEVLAQYQAMTRDDYRDAEPGKILHELRRGELAHFKLIPHTPYYGTADATPLYLITLHAAWRATGDRSLIERHLQTAEACLTWIDKYGDRDGDGFQEYQKRSKVGYAHSDAVPAIIGRRLHQGFARSRSIRHRDWRENQSNTRPKLGPVSTHLLRACLNEFGEGGVYDPLNQGAVVDVGVRVATLAVLRKASVFQFFC